MTTLASLLEAGGRDPTDFPTTMATTWLYLTDDAADGRAMLERLGQMVRRPTEDLAGRLPIGSSAACLDLLGRYRQAGLQRIVVWPMRDDVEQLERIAREVMPFV